LFNVDRLIHNPTKPLFASLQNTAIIATPIVVIRDFFYKFNFGFFQEGRMDILTECTDERGEMGVRAAAIQYLPPFLTNVRKKPP